VNLLGHIYDSLDDGEGSRIIWIHGTAGVGKSAVAFTVADRMKGLKATERTSVEKRLAGTFFFSRNYANRRMTGYFFATLAYQLASNFPSIRNDVSTVIRENPSLSRPRLPP
jgi:deoxyadenosine/deoxycytidine kinase